MWYEGPRNYPPQRGYCDRDSYAYDDENPKFGNFNRGRSPPRKDDSYSYGCANRDDSHMRYQVGIRNRCRAGPYQRGRGNGLVPPQRPLPNRASHNPKTQHAHTGRGVDHDENRRREPNTTSRECSPVRRESQIAEFSSPGSSTNLKSYSLTKNKGFTYQQLQQRRYAQAHGCNKETDKPRTPTDHTANTPKEVGSPHSSTSAKENPPASVTEPAMEGEEGPEEGMAEEEVPAAEEDVIIVPVSVKPKPTPEEEFKARRAQAIQSKAMEIETLYRQDCETFCMVVKMLVAKDPKLEKLIEGPLKENLLEIKQRCLDDLKHFIKELDQVTHPPDTSEVKP